MFFFYSMSSNPTVAKNKMGIKDCQLILTVICLTIVDIFFWIVYIIVEAVLTHFNVGTEPNTERPGSTDGVSYSLSCVATLVLCIIIIYACVSSVDTR